MIIDANIFFSFIIFNKTENGTVVNLAEMLLIKNYNLKEINHISKQKEKIKELYGDILCYSMNDNEKRELNPNHAVFNMIPQTATITDWMGIFEEFVCQIETFTGKEITETLEPDFTTTTKISRAVGQLSIMAAMKEYFDYHVIMCICGFPFIVVEGSIVDYILENIII